MSDTQDGSHESIDTSPLTLGQLSDHELATILSIEHQLKIMQAGASEDARNAKKAKLYLAPVQVRHPQVLLLDGARGTGKTSLLLTMAHWWNIHDGCSVQRPDRAGAQYQTRVKRIMERLPFKPACTTPTHIHPLRILDFDPLPPQMPLIAGIVQAWQPLAKKYDELSGRSEEECDGEVATLEDQWTNLFRVGAVGWSPVPTAKGLLEQVLDRQEQLSDWQRLGQRWYEFVEKVIASGKCLSNPHKLGGEPVFVIMIDDVDLQVERIRELLPALRLLYHPNVAFLVAAHWEHLIDTLGLDFLGQQNRLVNRQADRNAWSEADGDKWAGTLATAAATKVFPRKNRWTLRKLTLYELLAFPDHGTDADEPADGGTSARPTMKMMLNGWHPSPESPGLGDYLEKLSRGGDDPYEIPPFITYREAHQVFERASMEREEKAKAIEAIRCLISDPESEAVALESEVKFKPIVEYRGVGQLVALFRPGQVEETGTSSGIVFGVHPDFFYREKPNSEAIFLQRSGGTTFNFTKPMLAVTIQDAHYGVAVPDLQWNIRLALVWTKVEVPDDNSLLKLAFQWRFHEHPDPFRLLDWSHKWREFVRGFQARQEERLDRVAYAWTFYQLKWLEVGTNGAPSPLDAEPRIDDHAEHWEPLLKVVPEANGQTWWTQTLPLLARPELGLHPDLQCRLLRVVSSGAGSQDGNRQQRQWLKAQRRRLVTDAIIAAEEEEGGRAQDAENEERVDRIVDVFEQQHQKTHGKPSPWWDAVEDPAGGT